MNSENGLFARMKVGDYEQVALWYDKAVGLRAIIAIHDTTLGPALGGTRMYPYATEDDAIIDALRLARAMTYKCAAAGLNLGGGKAVIIGDPAKDKSEGLFRSFGRFVHSLGGRYITTTDVGTSIEDLIYVREETPYVTGLPENMGGSGGTSRATAVGIVAAMEVCAREALQASSLSGIRVAVQGVGKVGGYLVEFLTEQGAVVTIADVNENRAKEVASQFPAKVVPTPEIHREECDIFSPNGMGGIINDETIPSLRCSIVAGGANNQLAEEHHGDLLQDVGILYAPDYIINAGGVINCAEEMDGYNLHRAMDRVKGIGRVMERLIAYSKKHSVSVSRAANHLAEERIRTIGQVHRTYVSKVGSKAI
ncbi:MAG: Glu/Leu/Phe/Val dehydrogenase dimerization region [Dehalococcoidia bacterium]|nr:Glu/Leu/Phe/Val dehydrogenase dimerization region [Dehalococcoidia bacterium]